MPKFKVLKDFPYFHGGYSRVDYKAGEVVDIDDEEMIEAAIDQQWIKPAESKPPKSNKSKVKE